MTTRSAQRSMAIDAVKIENKTADNEWERIGIRRDEHAGKPVFCLVKAGGDPLGSTEFEQVRVEEWRTICVPNRAASGYRAMVASAEEDMRPFEQRARP